MNVPSTLLALTFTCVTLVCGAGKSARAETPRPAPGAAWTIDDVARMALVGRPEIAAARARTRAAEQRPAIVGALEDPMLMPSVEFPFMFDGVSAGLLFEQEFPLSSVLARRAEGARAQARGAALQGEIVGLDVVLEATTAFHMLWGRRENRRILEAQIALARQLVAATAARYGAGAGSQGQVLRAEAELARLEAGRRSLARSIQADEAMLAVRVGEEVTTPIPELVAPDPEGLAADDANAPGEPARSGDDDAGLAAGQPEVQVGDAEVRRWTAEVGAMRSMYAPMARLQTGPVYATDMGAGWMVMFGVSLPVWRGKLDAGVDEARAMVAMAKADREAMRRMVAAAIAEARQLVAGAHARYQALVTEVLPRVRAAADAALAGYGSGRDPQVAVIEALQMLGSVEREVVAARMELGLARARLDRARGRWRAPKDKP